MMVLSGFGCAAGWIFANTFYTLLICYDVTIATRWLTTGAAD